MESSAAKEIPKKEQEEKNISRKFLPGLMDIQASIHVQDAQWYSASSSSRLHSLNQGLPQLGFQSWVPPPHSLMPMCSYSAILWKHFITHVLNIGVQTYQYLKHCIPLLYQCFNCEIACIFSTHSQCYILYSNS